MTPTIAADSLSFGYRLGITVIDGWSGTIDAGETVAITGPSGSGKSTLLYVLGTLVKPWGGSLSIAGVNVGRLADRARSDIRARKVGFVFQDAMLDPRRSVLDNVVEGAVYRGDRLVDARQRALALLAKFDVQVEPRRRATDLSGGQAQRIALCRALLGQPPIILADEPTGNLDRENAQIVCEALFREASNGASVVIATHDSSLAAKCDRTLGL